MQMTRVQFLARTLMERTILFIKMFLDRRRSRGCSEFRFRWQSAPANWSAIKVQARTRDFVRTVYMRKRTSDLWTFEQVFCNNDYNLRKLARWDDIARSFRVLRERGTPLILDLGANVGLASLYFASNWPEARIVAVEPDNGNFSTLSKNVAGMRNVHALNAAIANSEGAVRIANPDAQAWAIRTELAIAGDPESVPAVDIPTLLRQHDDEGRECLPFICKIDIEGFEKNLFAKNLDWIALFPLIIIELHDWMMPGQATSNAFLRAISAHDRDFVYIGENVFSIRNDNPSSPADSNANALANHMQPSHA